MADCSFPAWIDFEYFEGILSRIHKNSSIKVLDVRVEPCSAGDGFLSTMLRTHVEYALGSELKIKPFVLKFMTDNEFVNNRIGVNGFDIHNREMLFFEVIASQIEKCLKTIGEHENIIPEVLAVDRQHEAIVFADLKVKEFEMADRMSGLDVIHIRLALKKLAKFHAASLIIHQKYPKAFESFDTGIFSRRIDSFNVSFVSMYELLVEEVETWAGYENYAIKMKRLESSLIEAALRCFDNDPGDLCVLNHGDMWTNNLMFKYGINREVADAVLVKLCRSCSNLCENVCLFRSTSSSAIGRHPPSILFISFTRL